MSGPPPLPRAGRVPGDLILEPGERVLVASRPLYLWEPLVALALALLIGGFVQTERIAQYAILGAGALLVLWLLLRWIPWRARWFVLTDRRIIVRWGVLNRTLSSLLLDRIQDASLERPFPLRLIRDYGVIRLESAGEHSEARISHGLDSLAMAGATAFYRALTEAQTPGR